MMYVLAPVWYPPHLTKLVDCLLTKIIQLQSHLLHKQQRREKKQSQKFLICINKDIETIDTCHVPSIYI